MKRKSIFFYAVTILFLLGIYYLTLEPFYTPTALSTPNQKFLLPRFIAHKSIASDQTKGNSREAILKVLKTPVDGIELDVRLSKDKIPFIYHADNLDPSQDNERPEDKNWSELKSFTISLEEVFKIVGHQKYLFLDIKEKRIFNNGFSEKIAELIEKYQNHETVIVESINPIFLLYMRLYSRDIMIMYSFLTDATAFGEEIQSQFDAIPWLLKQPFVQKQLRRILRPDILGARWNIKGSYLQNLIEHGYPIISWTVDDVNVASKLFYSGVTGVQTNRAIKLMQALNVELPRKIIDAGGTQSYVADIIYINKIDDVKQALVKAIKNKKKISIAGRRHSMGGQSLLSDSIHLNMLGFNNVRYNPNTRRVTAEAGAIWKKIQKILDKYHRSIKVMQSDNIFTIGGSVSVNVHGWQVGMPPLGSTIHSLKVLTPKGEIQTISLTNRPELFRAFIGGYGQFGVILEVELETTENSKLEFKSKVFPTNQFKDKFKQLVSQNPNVELAYGRFSVDQGNLLSEAMLNWYERVDSDSLALLQPEKFVAIKRAVFRFSEYFDIGKKFRWKAEKSLTQQLQNSVISRNNVMNTDIHVLWPLRKDHIDILQEYFIPKDKLDLFIDKLRICLKMCPANNLLNLTIREVKEDTISALPYAKTEVFALVLLFSQSDDANGEYHIEKFTRMLIKETLALNGSFYLPYRLHYTHQELIQAYPMFENWLALKKKYDPNFLFFSEFMYFISKN